MNMFIEYSEKKMLTRIVFESRGLVTEMGS
jgi:hypothetical protein